MTKEEDKWELPVGGVETKESFTAADFPGGSFRLYFEANQSVESDTHTLYFATAKNINVQK